MEDRGIKLWGIGKNPTQHEWTDSAKSYGFYIDDMCVGIPTVIDSHGREMVDWVEIDKIFTPKLEKIYKHHARI